MQQSEYFRLRTDLPPLRAEKIVRRMETAIEFAARYWRRPLRGRIDCYLVSDLRNWPDASLPHPLARVFIGGIGGATIDRVTRRARVGRNQAMVFASTRPGVAEHEVVHAYCWQTFGATGPDWYKEGMAETAVYRKVGEAAVHCPAALLQSMRRGRPPAVREIVCGGPITGRIGDSLDAMLAHPDRAGRCVPLSQWTRQDTENVACARQRYLWSWALCYMLMHNPNYSARFRLLGQAYLTRRQVSFQQVFGPMGDEIDFEYAWFLKHAGAGYRVDLCRWDWHRRFRCLDPSHSLRRRIWAARGYQASGLSVCAGQTYAYRAEGSWCTSAHQAASDADGNADGSAKLVGVVMKDFTLSEPIPLGSCGSFVAPTDGQLYLRCRDAWNRLSDNRGDVLVELSRPKPPGS